MLKLTEVFAICHVALNLWNTDWDQFTGNITIPSTAEHPLLLQCVFIYESFILSLMHFTVTHTLGTSVRGTTSNQNQSERCCSNVMYWSSTKPGSESLCSGGRSRSTRQRHPSANRGHAFRWVQYVKYKTKKACWVFLFFSFICVWKTRCIISTM